MQPQLNQRPIMPLLKPPRVTIDTNVCNVIHSPDSRPKQVPPEDARKVRQAIQDGRVLGFISEASLFIECLSFEAKLAYLAVAVTDKARPTPDPRAVARFRDIANVGAKLLQAPLIAAETFIEGFIWAGDDVFNVEDRKSRFNNLCRSLGGVSKLKRCGETLDAKFPLCFHGTPMRGPMTWSSAFQRAWESDPAGQKKFRNNVGPIISEWCDVLIVGSHFAYGNDVFCTIDSGKKAGPESILHHSNRAALEDKGITVMTPSELAQTL